MDTERLLDTPGGVRDLGPAGLAKWSALVGKGGPAATLTFGILRRGIAYGPAYDHGDPAAPGNSAERGLLFLCYQTDLTQQFELLAQRWANQPERPRQGLDNGVDLLIGRTRPGAPRRARLLGGEVSTMADYVIPRGGAYLFAPSLSAIRALAAGG
ncbi:Dyp-type peroxidase [Actinoplanes ianthinogenes]|uniref:Dyp-type peroxidase n=1 Tax=Actinoplanes ianthinogenes TaxID=122358 RepID=UPI00166FB933|nr:Dyp-type peroxidase [Actinoplanes ianthinogenes]